MYADHENARVQLTWRTKDGRRGIDVNTFEFATGRTPLHYAVIHAGAHQEKTDPWINIMRTLIERHAGLNMQDRQGHTPLDYAIANENALVARYLVTHGAVVLDAGTLTIPYAQNFLRTHVFNI